MTKAKKTVNRKIRDLLSEVWFYLTEGFSMLIGLLVIVATTLSVAFFAIWLAIAPMQYWSPWWGLVSVPVVATLVISILLWRSDRNG